METVFPPFLILVLSPRPFLFSSGFLNLDLPSETPSKVAAISPQLSVLGTCQSVSAWVTPGSPVVHELLEGTVYFYSPGGAACRYQKLRLVS